MKYLIAVVLGVAVLTGCGAKSDRSYLEGVDDLYVTKHETQLAEDGEDAFIGFVSSMNDAYLKVGVQALINFDNDDVALFKRHHLDFLGSAIYVVTDKSYAAARMTARSELEDLYNLHNINDVATGIHLLNDENKAFLETAYANLKKTCLLLDSAAK